MPSTQTMTEVDEHSRFTGKIVSAKLAKTGGGGMMNLAVRLIGPNSLEANIARKMKGQVLFSFSESDVGSETLNHTRSAFRGSKMLSVEGHATTHFESSAPTGDMLTINEKAFEPSKRAKAILRALEFAKADLQAAGGTFTMNEVRALFGDISRQAISKRVRDHNIFAIQGKKGTTVFPTLQFGDDGQPIAGLKEVLRALPTRSGWATLNFLVNPHNDLDNETPIETLRSGDIESVIFAARRMGVQAG